MKKSLVAAVTLAFVATVPTSAHGQESAGPALDPATCTPTDAHPCHSRTPVADPLPPGHQVTGCGYPIDLTVVRNEEIDEAWAYTDGTTVDYVTGRLVIRFTNHDHPYHQVLRDVSGSTTETFAPGGTLDFKSGTGDNWWSFGPKGQARTGEPGLVVTHGFVFIQAVPPVAQNFGLEAAGTQENLCALLKA